MVFYAKFSIVCPMERVPTVINDFLQRFGVDTAAEMAAAETALMFAVVLLVAGVAYLLVTRSLVPVAERIAARTAVAWDDYLVESGVLGKAGRLVPLAVIYAASDIFFSGHPLFAELIKRVVMALLIVAGVGCLDGLLNTVRKIAASKGHERATQAAGYVGIARIGLYLLAGIGLIAVVTNKSPWGIISLLGGLTAALLLVFKDTILGFVASLQLSAHDMVRVGDWLEMPRFNADGDVVDLSIHTVKVRNWDKTITTIPTYALVSNSFKNWRGMSESGGRRIKRSIFIDMNSICFCTSGMLERFSRVALLREYLEAKREDIEAYNRRLGLSDDDDAPNGRSQTNIGVFRAYVRNYLASHPKIHQEMTFLVRHLAPTPKGLPIEIYVFCNDIVWANYEEVQADIFDHILAVVPFFGLRVFQEPCGADFSRLVNNKETENV